MFEDSLFASGVSVDARRSAGRRRWFALASVGVQGLFVAGFIVVPMVWPETLPPVSIAPKMMSLVVHKPEVKVQPKVVRVETRNSAAVRAPSAAPMVESRSSGVIAHPSLLASNSDAPSLYVGSMTGGPASIAGLMRDGAGSGSGPTVVAAAPKKSVPLVISQGVSKGLLLAPIQPIYPRIAVAARVEGTVVVTATIDKQGRITGLRVISGPEMLRTAAVDAVQDARYKPFLLSGQPTDVITTISVTFRLSA